MSEMFDLESYKNEKENPPIEKDLFKSPYSNHEDFRDDPEPDTIPESKKDPVDTKISLIQKTLDTLLGIGESRNKYDVPGPLNLNTPEPKSEFLLKNMKNTEDCEEGANGVSGFLPEVPSNSPKKVANNDNERCASSGMVAINDNSFSGDIDAINAGGDVQSEEALSGAFEEATFSSMLKSKLQEFLPANKSPTSFSTILDEPPEEPELIVKPLPSTKQRSAQYYGTNILKPKKKQTSPFFVPDIAPENWVTKNKPFLVAPPVVQLLPSTKTKHQVLPQGMAMRNSSPVRERQVEQNMSYRPRSFLQKGHIITPYH